MVNYIFLPYNPLFPQFFENEKRRLNIFLTGEYIIEHFGSTAVKGLGGKGIIDIYVVIPLPEMEKTKKELEKADYESRPKSGTDKRFIFVREIKVTNDRIQRYHIHLTDNSNIDYRTDIAFRDYLRKHPDDVKKYSIIKQKAAKQANQSKERYMSIKESIIQKILAKALAKLP